MKKHRFLLALLLTLTTVIPARAATVMASELALPELDEPQVINVTVPSTGRIILNPYGMPVDTDSGTSKAQVISNPLPVINESEVPVIVSASVTGHISERSSMTFASEPPPTNTGEKAVFLYVEFQSEYDAWQGGYTGTENQMLVSAETSEEKEVLTLDASPSEGVFQVFGATSVSPDDPWCSDDTVSVILTFSFTALTAPSEDAETVPDGEVAVEPPVELDETGNPNELEIPNMSETPDESVETPEELFVVPSEDSAVEPRIGIEETPSAVSTTEPVEKPVDLENALQSDVTLGEEESVVTNAQSDLA